MKHINLKSYPNKIHTFISYNKEQIFLSIKYGFSLIFTLLAFINIGDFRYLIPQLLELLLIFLCSNMLLSHRPIGQIVNSICMILYNAQIAVMFFANSYITMVMLTNFDSLEALSGNASIYILTTALVGVISLLPIYPVTCSNLNLQHILTSTLSLELIFTLFCGNSFSPLYGYASLGIQQYEMTQLNKNIQSSVQATNKNVDSSHKSTEAVESESSYYNTEITDYRKKDPSLSDQPNVVLIFTEGLSQSVISDERGIMRHLSDYQNISLRFSGYYNHTFATYRGLIGQLYSGYQLQNTDTNSLISLQSILSDQGYHTAFINAEPHNDTFTKYLENFQFDQLIGDTDMECRGDSHSIADKDMYELLYDTMEKYSEEDTPYFISMYTFGTHVSLDSPDEVFGEGSNAELNKFYNLDQQFHDFMSRFVESSLSANTIIVFTSDHATYKDDAYDSSFPLHPRTVTSLDEIPLFIYYPNITPEEVQVYGRNSLDLVPTILDYLDISVPNYFLGTSLFADEAASSLETTYSDSYNYYSTKDGNIATLSDEETKEFRNMQQQYFVTKENHNISQEKEIGQEANH